jgi:hypothetical protein
MLEDTKPGRDPFAPDRWETNAGEASAPATAAPVSRQQRRRRAGRFLKGPVPWRWLALALALPGKALAVGLMLWQLRGMTNRATVLFCLTRAEAEGIPTTTARRAISRLEAAGLVAVRRRPGRGLDVTILDASEDEPSGGRRISLTRTNGVQPTRTLPRSRREGGC